MTHSADDAGRVTGTLETNEGPNGVDEAAVERMRTVAYVLDESIPVPGTDYRIGLDPIVGLVPGVGDALGAVVSSYVVLEAARLGVSPPTLVRMIGNVALDAAAGSVPHVGTAFDAVWKPNRRNLRLALADLAAGDPTNDGSEAVEIEID